MEPIEALLIIKQECENHSPENGNDCANCQFAVDGNYCGIVKSDPHSFDLNLFHNLKDCEKISVIRELKECCIDVTTNCHHSCYDCQFKKDEDFGFFTLDGSLCGITTRFPFEYISDYFYQLKDNHLLGNDSAVPPWCGR